MGASPLLRCLPSRLDLGITCPPQPPLGPRHLGPSLSPCQPGIPFVTVASSPSCPSPTSRVNTEFGSGCHVIPALDISMQVNEKEMTEREIPKGLQKHTASSRTKKHPVSSGPAPPNMAPHSRSGIPSSDRFQRVCCKGSQVRNKPRMPR